MCFAHFCDLSYGYPTVMVRLSYGKGRYMARIWLVSGVEREGGGAEVVTLLVYIPAFNAWGYRG